MAYKTRAKMPVSQRAKQFMPFSAVKGMDEALAKQEREAIREERHALWEEQIEAINKALCRLKTGMEISIRFFSAGQYRKLCGPVELIDAVRQVLRIKGTSIPFEDIQEIRIHRI